MTYTILLFVTRNPKLSPSEFKPYYENVHIPLAQRLCNGNWPFNFTRRYLARITRAGFGCSIRVRTVGATPCAADPRQCQYL